MGKKQKTKPHRKPETDSVFFLKLLMYFMVASLWVHIAVGDTVVPLPVGGAVGVVLASHDHFKIDRKIDLAIILVAGAIGYLLGARFILAA